MPSEEFESELDVGEEEEEVPKPSSLRSVLQLPKIIQNLKSNAHQKLPIGIYQSEVTSYERRRETCGRNE